jgi:hypothetical protein
MTVVFCFFFTNCRKITKNAVSYVAFLLYHIIWCLKPQSSVGMYKTRDLSRAVSWTGPLTDFSIAWRNCWHFLCHPPLSCFSLTFNTYHTWRIMSLPYQVLRLWYFKCFKLILNSKTADVTTVCNYCQICALVKVKNCRLRAHRIKGKNSIKWCLAVLQMNSIYNRLSYKNDIQHILWRVSEIYITHPTHIFN